MAFGYSVVTATGEDQATWGEDELANKRKRMLHELCRGSLDFKRQQQVDQNVENKLPPDDARRIA